MDAICFFAKGLQLEAEPRVALFKGKTYLAYSFLCIGVVMHLILAEASGGGSLVALMVVIGLLAAITKAVTAEPKKKSYDVRIGGKITER